MTKLIEEFILQLHNEKNTSSNTEISYKRDLNKLYDYLKKENFNDDITTITEEDLKRYVAYLSDIGRAPTTISRNVASIKAFLWLFVR